MTCLPAWVAFRCHLSEYLARAWPFCFPSLYLSKPCPSSLQSIQGTPSKVDAGKDFGKLADSAPGADSDRGTPACGKIDAGGAGGSDPGVVVTTPAMDRAYDDFCKMEGEEIFKLNPGRPTADIDGGGGSRTTPEAHDDGGVFLVLGPGASTETELLITSARTPATQINVVTYTDWATAHGAHASDAPSLSVAGAYAYPDVVMAPAPATRSSVPSTGPVIGGESYTDMLMAHLSSDMSPVAWNNVMADLGSERLHTTGTVAAAAATELGGGYYYNNSGIPFAAQVVDEADLDSQEELVGAVAEPGRGGGLGGLGLAATSLAMAGLIAGGVDTPVTAITLFGMMIAGVILVTVRVFRA